MAGLLGQVQQALRIGQQLAAGGGEVEAPPFAHEQFHPQVRLQLAHPGGDVGLHPVEAHRRPGDAALRHHGAEDVQVCQFHERRSLPLCPGPRFKSQKKNIKILIIHFSRT